MAGCRGGRVVQWWVLGGGVMGRVRGTGYDRGMGSMAMASFQCTFGCDARFGTSESGVAGGHNLPNLGAYRVITWRGPLKVLRQSVPPQDENPGIPVRGPFAILPWGVVFGQYWWHYWVPNG